MSIITTSLGCSARVAHHADCTKVVWGGCR